jgi:hypothetical protein
MPGLAVEPSYNGIAGKDIERGTRIERAQAERATGHALATRAMTCHCHQRWSRHFELDPVAPASADLPFVAAFHKTRLKNREAVP